MCIILILLLLHLLVSTLVGQMLLHLIHNSLLTTNQLGSMLLIQQLLDNMGVDLESYS